MKNETIKLYNIKYFCKKNIQNKNNFYTHIYLTFNTYKIYI